MQAFGTGKCLTHISQMHKLTKMFHWKIRAKLTRHMTKGETRRAKFWTFGTRHFNINTLNDLNSGAQKMDSYYQPRFQAASNGNQLWLLHTEKAFIKKSLIKSEYWRIPQKFKKKFSGSWRYQQLGWWPQTTSTRPASSEELAVNSDRTTTPNGTNPLTIQRAVSHPNPQSRDPEIGREGAAKAETPHCKQQRERLGTHCKHHAHSETRSYRTGQEGSSLTGQCETAASRLVVCSVCENSRKTNTLYFMYLNSNLDLCNINWH